MGPIAARKAMAVIRNAEQVLAIEALAAAQAVEFHAPLKPAPGAAAVLAVIRGSISRMVEDRGMYIDLAASLELVRSGALIAAAEEAIGPLD